LQADIVALEDLEEEAAEGVSIAMDQLHKARGEFRSDELCPSYFEQDPDSPDNSDGLSIHFGNNNIVDPNTGDETPKMTPQKTSDLWEEAEKLVGAEQYMVKLGGRVLKRKMSTGSWYNPFGKSRSEDLTTRKVVEDVIPSGFFSRITKSESYAVVTFTSRQAAIAARQCLSDGSGLDGWREVDKIPIPPLADSVPWNICDCRGCCRPVTVTLPPQERRFRFKL
jgi:hypothetical protein